MKLKLTKDNVDPAYCNNSVLRQAARRLGQHYDEVLAPTGLRATQLGMLSQIALMRQPALRELAAALVMDLSSLGNALKPQDRDGWIVISQDPTDRRVKRVQLAPDNMARFEDSLVYWNEAQSRFEEAFGKEKAEELRDVLSYIASGEFADALAKTAR